MSFFEFMVENRTEVWVRTGEHLMLVGIATATAVVIGVPLGIFLTRSPRLRAPVIGLTNIFQTIPSLALLGFILPLPLIGGLGARTAIVALVLYSLLPIVRNTFVGVSQVDSSIREAAKGLGMTSMQILRIVELPLAIPFILAGLRIATVVGVGVATIAAAIGAGGLGTFIFRGLSMVNTTTILAGAVPAAVMALVADGGLHLLERRLDWKSNAHR